MFVITFLLCFCSIVPISKAETVVSSWNDLITAINLASPKDTIVISDNLIADSTISVQKDIHFVAEGNKSISPKSGFEARAFLIDSATVSFQGISFDGFNSSNASYEGLSVAAVDASLDLTDCSFSNNISGNSGGAVYALNSSLSINNCSFYGNSAGVYGGAVFFSSINDPTTYLEINNTVFKQNVAKLCGGAVYSINGSCPILTEGCTFIENSVTQKDGHGGAVAANAPRILIANSNFKANSVDYAGAAISAMAGTLELEGSVFDKNVCGDEYDFGDDIALNSAYPESTVKLYIQNNVYSKGLDICEKADIIAFYPEGIQMTLESDDTSVINIDDKFGELDADGAAAARINAIDTGQASIVLRQDRGNIFASIVINVSTISAACDIRSVLIDSMPDVVFSREGNTFSGVVPYGTDVTSLTPIIDFDGQSISIPAGQAVDFSKPVPVTVTAQNGATDEFKLVVDTATPVLEVVGVPENMIVFAGAEYRLVPNIKGGEWTVFNQTASYSIDGDELLLNPFGAGGGWVEYSAEYEGEVQEVKLYYTVSPSMLPMTGQDNSIISLLMLFAGVLLIIIRVENYRNKIKK